jgi:hypothetical protein
MAPFLLLALLQIQPALADVAFMAGHWVDASADALSEEVWTEPAGDSMLGMWRYVGKGQAQIFELLTLKAEAGEIVLRLRHFDPKLVGREERTAPVELRLVSRKPGEAVFEGPGVGGDGRVRLTYRSPDKDTLVGVLEKGPTPQEFSFRRRGATGP